VNAAVPILVIAGLAGVWLAFVLLVLGLFGIQLPASRCSRPAGP
jgi:hypothetical protein